MAFLAVTYTFTNGTSADATQVNQNFTDVQNAFSDGTKSLNMAAGTFAGTLTANGAVVLGASSANTLTLNASLGASVNISTNTSYDIGSSTLGLRSIYIGGSSTFTTRIIGGTQSGSLTLTLPVTAGSSRFGLLTDGSGNLSWNNIQGPTALGNLSLTASIGSNQLTISVVGFNGSAPSSTNPVDVAFRSGTAATGTSTLVSATSQPTITLNTTDSLGFAASVTQYIYIYLMNNAGTPVIAVSGSTFDEGSVQSSTQVGGPSTSNQTLYSQTASYSNLGIRLIGRIKATFSNPNWASVTEIALPPFSKQPVAARYTTTNATDFGGAAIVQFGSLGNKVFDTTNSFSTSTNQFTCPSAGKYLVKCSLGFTSIAYHLNDYIQLDIRKNSTAYSTQIFRAQAAATFNNSHHVMGIVDCAAGDTLDIYITPGTSVADPVLDGQASRNFVDIIKIGEIA